MHSIGVTGLCLVSNVRRWHVKHHNSRQGAHAGSTTSRTSKPRASTLAHKSKRSSVGAELAAQHGGRMPPSHGRTPTNEYSRRPEPRGDIAVWHRNHPHQPRPVLPAVFRMRDLACPHRVVS